MNRASEVADVLGLLAGCVKFVSIAFHFKCVHAFQLLDAFQITIAPDKYHATGQPEMNRTRKGIAGISIATNLTNL